MCIFNQIQKTINSFSSIEEGISFYLDKIRQQGEVFEKAQKIFLCGATPFAKNVLKNESWRFWEKVVIADDVENICSGGGGRYMYYVLDPICISI